MTQRPVPGTRPWLPTGHRPRAVVFDCDGTLMDTHPCVQDAVRTVFSDRRRPYASAAHTRITGLALPAQAALLADLLDEPADTIARDLLTALIDAVPRLARPLPGALELLRATAARFPVAVASNSCRALLQVTLAHGAMTDLARVTVAADDVRMPKPAPDPYLAACAALGVSPREALAVEDSATGVRAALAAGLSVLGVGPAVPSDQVHWWVPDLTCVHTVPTPLALW